MDAPEVIRSSLAGEYFITSIPTLLAFRRGQAQLERKLIGKTELGSRTFLEGWVREQAEREDEGGGGVGLFGGIFGR